MDQWIFTYSSIIPNNCNFPTSALNIALLIINYFYQADIAVSRRHSNLMSNALLRPAAISVVCALCFCCLYRVVCRAEIDLENSIETFSLQWSTMFYLLEIINYLTFIVCCEWVQRPSRRSRLQLSTLSKLPMPPHRATRARLCHDTPRVL